MNQLNVIFNRCIKQRKRMIENKIETPWFYINNKSYGFIKTYDFKHELFIISKHRLFRFIFDSTDANFAHVQLRTSENTIRLSGSFSADVLCNPMVFDRLSLKFIQGGYINDKSFIKKIFTLKRRKNALFI